MTHFQVDVVHVLNEQTHKNPDLIHILFTIFFAYFPVTQNIDYSSPLAFLSRWIMHFFWKNIFFRAFFYNFS